MDYPIFRLPKNGNSGSLLVLKVQAGIILSIFIIALCFPWISNGQITEGTYNLIDAEADTVLVQITDGMVWNLADADSLNVQAVNSYTVDRVVFDVGLGGTIVHNQGEGIAPYAAFSDVSGDYDNWAPLEATYTFSVHYQLNSVVQGTDSFSITFVNIPAGHGSSVWSESGATASYAGNVAIGTNSVPSGYTLAINGHVRAREVRVDQDTWPDYVFHKDYRLSSLQEVQKFIDTNGHLPNIPSAEQVISDGLQLGEMNRLLLEKIEEMTLYIIDQQQQIDHLRSEIKRLK